MFSRLRSTSQPPAKQNKLTDGKAVYQGMLEKRGRLNTAFKKRWCVLKEDGRLYYYKPDKETHRDYIILEHVEVRLAFSEPFAFEIVSKDRVFHFLAPSQEEREAWMKALSARTHMDEENGLIEQAENMISRATYLQCQSEEERQSHAVMLPESLLLFTDFTSLPPPLASSPPSSSPFSPGPSPRSPRSATFSSLPPLSSSPSSSSSSSRRYRSSSTTETTPPKTTLTTPNTPPASKSPYLSSARSPSTPSPPSSPSPSPTFLSFFMPSEPPPIGRSYSSPVLAGNYDDEHSAPVKQPTTPREAMMSPTPSTPTPAKQIIRKKPEPKKSSLFNFSQQLSRRKKADN